MIKIIINIIKCKIQGHLFVPAGSCPFTGNTYNMCTICSKMIPIDKIDE